MFNFVAIFGSVILKLQVADHSSQCTLLMADLQCTLLMADHSSQCTLLIFSDLYEELSSSHGTAPAMALLLQDGTAPPMA